MSLRGGPADTLLPVSGGPEPASKGARDGAGRGLRSSGKSELIKPSASTETPGPTPATRSGAPSTGAYGETGAHQRVLICLQAWPLPLLT